MSMNLKYRPLHSYGSLERYCLSARHSRLCSYRYLSLSIISTEAFHFFFISMKRFFCSMALSLLLAFFSASTPRYFFRCRFILKWALRRLIALTNRFSLRLARKTRAYLCSLIWAFFYFYIWFLT